MRILDSNNNELTTYDSSLGYLKNETITKHIPAVEGVEELFHYVTVREYPNGGKDVERVIDQKGVEAVPEHDEEEEIIGTLCIPTRSLHEGKSPLSGSTSPKLTGQ